MCDRCGRPFVSPVALQSIQPLCRLCRANFFSFERARSFAVHNDALSQAITLLKYEEITLLGNWFAGRLAGLISTEPEKWGIDVVMPVPLHRERERERGYNQSYLIARPLAKALALPLEAKILIRTRSRPSTLLLSRTDRWRAVRGAYALREGQQVDNLRILLVDDVMTTGATLDSCARTLKQAGAAVVLGLTVARVVPEWTSL
jgi:ComF family protein